MRRQPYDAPAWGQLALVQVPAGEIVRVRRAGLRALELDPFNARFYDLVLRTYGGTRIARGSGSAIGTPLPAPAP